ncbi:hypothetical protein G6F57_011380 [Rhizopus arrhizus]|nr:hypothetical protein G6F23_008334 [Rhizopus arrhizus]KAG0759810.1 hypothetical protein G6F24_008798 [Rhizopus arrhizus]KAG0782471.1 hypothetical protein G6F21_011093 [Rhizopus arrhizus]KAG0785780.1 hypothetical protein G6F22_007845 [Rhizopus arrhizus]KAG0806202.1 hypothetical protein G6F20_011314 [Rhizopus arrhizus]
MEQEKDIEYRLVDKILLPDFQSSLIFLPINQNLWNTAHNEHTIDKSIKKAETPIDGSKEEQEDYFYKAFAADKKTKKKEVVEKTRDEERFDLCSFARDLYENRLSMLEESKSTLISNKDQQDALLTKTSAESDMSSLERSNKRATEKKEKDTTEKEMSEKTEVDEAWMAQFEVQSTFATVRPSPTRSTQSSRSQAKGASGLKRSPTTPEMASVASSLKRSTSSHPAPSKAATRAKRSHTIAHPKPPVLKWEDPAVDRSPVRKSASLLDSLTKTTKGLVRHLSHRKRSASTGLSPAALAVLQDPLVQKAVSMDRPDIKAIQRTVYVEPDALHGLLKKGGKLSSYGSDDRLPPVWSDPRDGQRRPISTDSQTGRSVLSDDDTVRSREYATRVIRQTSVRQQVVNGQVCFEKHSAIDSLNAPPPIPRRSSKRYQEMIYPGDELSVDEQLDEMMRMLTEGY